MADIQEIPLDIQNSPEDIQNSPEDIQTNIPHQDDIALEIPSQVEPEKPKPKAKPKGRPKGAANKGPSKPRAKKVQVREVEVEESTPSHRLVSGGYEPSSPRRNLKIPSDPSTSDVAAAMLKMLQDQSFSRQNRQQRLYNSWFQ
jgi:hypothetical protein